ncbi:excalibur calcium-binding domain-containing protein [Dactylosporangium sp. NPDC051541]|uniref:excalibur calcium-binding domain-containing protein n=1 Tax=Dactylosporangium sp. NPDC051541 TaxID=3363977 RepID=UPI0037A6F9B3
MRTKSKTSTKVAVAVLLGVAAALPSAPAFAAAPKKYVNCTALQHDYPHGVARAGGTDKVKGKTKPVTTFTVNPAAYNLNKRLDGDNDGVACERR